MPPDALPSKSQFSTTQLERHSFGLFGSKSMPHCGGVPFVAVKRESAMTRLRALMTLIPWR